MFGKPVVKCAAANQYARKWHFRRSLFAPVLHCNLRWVQATLTYDEFKCFTEHMKKKKKCTNSGHIFMRLISTNH